ncbi:hypothetical protein RHMOL_Rhmol10G0170600 [Rhododendron molle]|uniref:Uncharacterized protein n=1 Tax=Rhododendron molle TaxID=49168 RepID=A0ACC0M3P4_RHOML|nr:hypothetical protein RHMOL_Rhmol10G0170600 [Rhododendron molle]
MHLKSSSFSVQLHLPEDECCTAIDGVRTTISPHAPQSFWWRVGWRTATKMLRTKTRMRGMVTGMRMRYVDEDA